jgi:hypothetical protein
MVHRCRAPEPSSIRIEAFYPKAGSPPASSLPADPGALSPMIEGQFRYDWFRKTAQSVPPNRQWAESQSKFDFSLYHPAKRKAETW